MERLVSDQHDLDYRIRRQTDRLISISQIPPRFLPKTLDNFTTEQEWQRKNLDLALAYVSKFEANQAAGRSIIMSGDVGTGKTHLACGIGQQVIRQYGAAVCYATVYDLLQFVKGSFQKGAEYTEAQAIRYFVNPALLIIDEVGVTKTTDFELQTLFTVINGRYEEQKPSIVISNLGFSELNQAMGERCIDRLRENGGIAMVFQGESQRRAQRPSGDL